MTRTFITIGFLALFALAPGCGCGDETSAICALSVVEVAGESASQIKEIGPALDESDSEPGIQVTVVVSSEGLDNGTEVTLAGGVMSATSEVQDSQAVFEQYTVTESTDTSTLRLHAQAVGQECFTSDQAFVVNPPGTAEFTCQIVEPSGSVNRSDDLDLATATIIDLNVVVSTNAPAGATVTLQVGKDQYEAKADGTLATLTDVALACPAAETSVTLEATVESNGETGTCSADILVSCGFNQCDVIGFDDTKCMDQPELGLTCNASNDSDLVEPGLQIDVVVESDAPTGSSVTLAANGLEIGTADFTGGLATVDVTVPEGVVALTASCTDLSSNVFDGPQFDVFVDSILPDAIDDLSCVDALTDPPQVDCQFTVPEDSAGSGSGVVSFDLRFDEEALDEDNFDDGDGQETGPAGASVSVQEVNILVPDDCSYFAAKVIDGAGNPSEISNLPPRICPFGFCEIAGFTPAALTTALGTTLNATHDTSTDADLQAQIEVQTDVADGGSVTITIDGSDGTALGTIAGGAAALIETLPEGSVTLIATCDDGAGDVLMSDPLTVFVDTIVPGAPTGFACSVTDPREGTINCTWTPPADGDLGPYQLRYIQGDGDDLITGVPAFATATAATPAPGAGASSYDLTDDADNDIHLGSYYDLALRAVDAAGNVSVELSNDTPLLFVTLRTITLGDIAIDDGFGFDMAAGDFNCDGAGDIAIAAPGLSSIINGTVYVYLAGPSGLPTTPDAEIAGDTDAIFGFSMAGLGDFDGDGCDDFAVGAAEADFSGSMNVYLGHTGAWSDRTEGDVGTGAELRFLGSSTGALGTGVTGPGDFNDDGMNDMAFNSYDPAFVLGQEVLIAYGEALTLMGPGVSPVEAIAPDDVDVRYQSLEFDTGGGAFGTTGLGGGDFDGDGFADVAAGGTDDFGGPGGAFVLFGAPADAVAGPEVIAADSATRSYQLTGFADGVDFGFAVVGAPGIDGSGTSLVVGDTGFNSLAGRVAVFDVTGPGSDAAEDVVVATITNVEPLADGDQLGTAVADAFPWTCGGGDCDLDGDGTSDLVVSASQLNTEEGAVLAFFGSAVFSDRTTDQVNLLLTYADSDRLGVSLSFLPDQNGDGFLDFAAGDIGSGGLGGTAGRVRILY